MENTARSEYDRIAFYKNMYDNIMDAVLFSSPDGRVLKANAAACELFGMSEEEITQKGRSGLLDLDDPRLPGLLQERATTGKTRGELTWIKKDGSRFPGEFSSSVFKNEAGEDRTCIVIHDLSEIRRVENELRENEIRFRLALDVTNEGIWEYDTTKEFHYFSAIALKILGFDEHQLLTIDDTFNMVQLDDLDFVRKSLHELLDGIREYVDIEFRINNNLGEPKWIRAKGKVVHRYEGSSDIRLIGTFTDITELKNIEDELRRNREVFLTYFEHGPVGMTVNTPDNRWKVINQEFCRLMGYSKEELFSMNWEQITHPDDVELNQELVRKIKDGELDHFRMEKRYIRKDGSILYATLSMVTLRNQDGSVNSMIVSFLDNTEQIQALENLRQERHILRTLVDNLPFPIYFIDKNGKKVIANLADLQNIGKSDEAEVLGKTDEELFPGEVGKRGHADNLKVLETGDSILNREEDFIDKKGNKRWLQTTKIPLFDSNQQISGLVGIGLDITEQKILQDKIRESEAYYRTLVNVSPDAIVVADKTGKINFVSNKIYEILRMSDKVDLAGKSVFSWIIPEDLEFAKSCLQNVLNNDIKAPSQSFRCRRMDGSMFWGETTASLLENDEGFMIVFRDISDRKQAEEEILMAKTKAEESDRFKSVFLQNISHEIRTPMNSIIGFMEILEDPGFTRNEKKLYANIVSRSGHRLLNTIHDIIEISRIMTSQTEVRADRLNAFEFVQDHFMMFKPIMKEKGLAFVLNCAIDQSVTLSTDEEKLSTILKKILDNANKFTSEGSVELSVQQRGNFLEFKVKDTGIGIEPEKLAAIFRPFYQSDQNFNRMYEGAGLGLSISKAYLDMLHGEICVDSSLEAGTTVYFSLPLDMDVATTGVKS